MQMIEQKLRKIFSHKQKHWVDRIEFCERLSLKFCHDLSNAAISRLVKCHYLVHRVFDIRIHHRSQKLPDRVVPEILRGVALLQDRVRSVNDYNFYAYHFEVVSGFDRDGVADVAFVIVALI
jgi:hypothetical protein